jgi:hypothetical protein
MVSYMALLKLGIRSHDTEKGRVIVEVGVINWKIYHNKSLEVT